MKTMDIVSKLVKEIDDHMLVVVDDSILMKISANQKRLVLGRMVMNGFKPTYFHSKERNSVILVLSRESTTYQDLRLRLKSKHLI